MGDVWANSAIHFFANSLEIYVTRSSSRDGEESILTGSHQEPLRMYTKHALKGEQDFTG